jgi:hypothetical protein
MEYVFSSVQGVAQCLGDLAAINCMYMPYRLPEIYPHILIGKSRREYVYTMDSGAQHILIGKSRRGYVYTMDSRAQRRKGTVFESEKIRRTHCIWIIKAQWLVS